MQSTGQRENSWYRILLLLVVGLAAFSSAMTELNRVQDFTLQTGRLVAEWTGNAPAREVREVRVVHFQKRDGKQCSRSSSLQ